MELRSKKSTAKPAHDASEKKIELLTRMLEAAGVKKDIVEAALSEIDGH